MKFGNLLGMMVAGLIGVLLFGLVFALVVTIPVMLIWNSIIPDITNGGLTTLSFWQAFGLVFLISFLLRSHIEVKRT